MSAINLALLVVAAVFFATGIILERLAARRRLQSSLRAFRLTFPRGLKAVEVGNFLDGLSGLLLPWWRRWLASPFVVLETEADA